VQLLPVRKENYTFESGDDLHSFVTSVFISWKIQILAEDSKNDNTLYGSTKEQLRRYLRNQDQYDPTLSSLIVSALAACKNENYNRANEIYFEMAISKSTDVIYTSIHPRPSDNRRKKEAQKPQFIDNPDVKKLLHAIKRFISFCQLKKISN